MQNVIFEREGVIVVCLQIVRFVNEQKVVVSIIIHIVNVLLALHWRGWKCAGNEYFFYFCVIRCSLEF
jgi:hypothetical protein